MTDTEKAWQWAKKEGLVNDEDPKTLIPLEYLVKVLWRVTQENLNPKTGVL